MAKGDRVIAVSNFIANHIIDNYKIDPNKIRVIHRGVNLNYFNSAKVAEQRIVQLVQKLHIPVDRPIILLPGRLTRWKGQSVLLKALSSMAKGKIFCLIVGDDKDHHNYRYELQEEIKTLNLLEDVTILSHVQDMPALYMLADIVLSTSIEPEAFGRVSIEAQAMKKMLIATDIGGAKETVLNDKTGWLIPPNDPSILADKIGYVLGLDLETKQKIGDNARRYIEENFSLEKMCSKTLAVYNELL
jgi:glycosyltransferase involved in cell wall biosynthesis